MILSVIGSDPKIKYLRMNTPIDQYLFVDKPEAFIISAHKRS